MARPNNAPQRIEKECEVCHETFSVPPSRKDSAKFCSLDCLGLSKRMKGNVTLKCVVCGKLFLEQKSMAHRRVTCSQKCNAKNRAKPVEKRCEMCGRTFEVPRSRARRARYCSRECFDRTKCKITKHPTRQQLEHLLETMTLMAVAKMYGVTDNAVRHWAKKMEVHVPNRDERREIKKRNKKVVLGASHRGPRKKSL